MLRNRPDTSTDETDVEKVRRLAAESGDTGLVLADEETGAADEPDETDVVLPSFDEAMDGAATIAGSLVDKSELIGKRFVIYDFDFMPGDIKINPQNPEETILHADGIDRNVREFVIVRIVTAPTPETASEYLVFTDGGTGVYGSLRKLFDKHGVERVHCRRGLRVSKYEGPQGGESETYYLS